MLLALVLIFLVVFPVAYNLGVAPGYDEKTTEETPVIIDLPADFPASAHVYGKYKNLLKVIEVPEDVNGYGAFFDYGFYPATHYGGVDDLPAGFWVYVAPNWYI